MTRLRSRGIIDAARRVRCVLLIAALLIGTVLIVPAGATINNGENATDELGEFTSPPSSDTTPTYTKYCMNNGPTALGFGTINQDDDAYDFPIAFDTVHHRLFIGECQNNRVMVFTLNSDNTIASKTAANVLGQADFNSCEPDEGGGPSQSDFACPVGLAYDGVNDRLYVSDQYNSRVLVFNTSTITNGMNAAYELGCTDFIDDGCGGTTKSSLNAPNQLAFDSGNNRLYVADGGNNRVLVFSTSSLSNGENASYVLGQSNYTNNGANTTQKGIYVPYGLAYDSANTRLFVSDIVNNRVLVFGTSSLSNNENASYVLGQSSYTAEQPNDGGGDDAPSQSGLYNPLGIAYDSTNSRLFVADYYNSRVMEFNVATGSIANGENATAVLGQSDFYLQACDGANNDQLSLCDPPAVAYDSTNNLVYIGDSGNDRVMIYNAPTSVSSVTATTQTTQDACAIAGGQLYCWGADWGGEDGVGTNNPDNEQADDILSPEQVGGLTTWTTISQGSADYDTAACGIAGGALYCWGYNANGELGLGNTTEYDTPQ